MPLVFTKPQIRRYLAEMGYADLNDNALESFIKDLKKLIKHEDRTRHERKQAEAAQRQQPVNTTSRSSNSITSSGSRPDSENKSKREVPVALEERIRKGRKEVTQRAGTADGSSSYSSSAFSSEMDDENKTKQIISGDASVNRSRKVQRQAPPIQLRLGESTSGSSSHISASSSGQDSDDSENRSKRVIPIPEAIKRDPVALYHYYKSFWNRQKIPGQNRHMQLRWNVRAGTMGRVPCTPCGERVNYLTRY